MKRVRLFLGPFVVCVALIAAVTGARGADQDPQPGAPTQGAGGGGWTLPATAAAEKSPLTVAARATRNPDGVVFYKLWNGRTAPKMPAFSTELSKEQAWAIVAYVQTLRARTSGTQ